MIGIGIDAVDVERLERVGGDHAVVDVLREELALRIVARVAEGSLSEVIRPEAEELRHLGNF